MRSLFVILLFILLQLSTIGYSQNTRINDRNEIGWYNYFGTFHLNKKVSLHTEYQWRRAEFISNWQQSLLRIGMNYQMNQKMQFRFGYAWAETFAYGDFPINGFGKDFTEHRLYEMLTMNDKSAGIDFTHRFILEQRWLGKYSNSSLEKEDEYVFANRLRYMLRLQKSITNKQKSPYIAIYDEVMIGFGKNVNENIFDQNRIGILLGYKFNSTLKVEAGYLCQIVQLGREINGRNVFQYNQGIIVNAILNFNLFNQKKVSK